MKKILVVSLMSLFSLTACLDKSTSPDATPTPTPTPVVSINEADLLKDTDLITPSTLSFNAPNSNVISESITIKNVQPNDVILNEGFLITSTNQVEGQSAAFSQINSCPNLLSAGSSCTVVVSFDPSTVAATTYKQVLEVYGQDSVTNEEIIATVQLVATVGNPIVLTSNDSNVLSLSSSTGNTGKTFNLIVSEGSTGPVFNLSFSNVPDYKLILSNCSSVFIGGSGTTCQLTYEYTGTGSPSSQSVLLAGTDATGIFISTTGTVGPNN